MHRHSASYGNFFSSLLAKAAGRLGLASGSARAAWVGPRARGGGLHHQESPTTGVPFAHLADLGNADGALPTRGVTLGALGDSFLSPDEAAARTPPSAARSGAAPQSADLPSRLRESGVLARI